MGEPFLECKNWNRKDTSIKDKLLIEQTYPGDEDIRKHYEYVLKAFKDKRYLTQDGKPIFLVWNPKDVPVNFIPLWQKWSKEDGFPGIYFIANVDAMDKTNYIAKGFDAMYYKRAQAVSTSILRHSENFSLWKFIKSRIKLYLFKKPALCFEYKEAMPYLIDEKIDRQEDIIPGLVPNFDHSPRSKQFGFICITQLQICFIIIVSKSLISYPRRTIRLYSYDHGMNGAKAIIWSLILNMAEAM